MDEVDALLGIGAFAHRVGLAPSALRFYDDCGVLRPAFVDEATGYRYYHPDQEARAVLLRRLRTAGMPLTEASAVLDGSREEARAVLEGHARTAREVAVAAQAAIEDILRDLAAEAPGTTTARIGGAELSSAVRQVAPAVAPSTVAEEFPVLGGVLIELDGHEVRLVATDRYRLAVRTLRPHSIEGGPHRMVVDASAMKDIVRWAVCLAEVILEFDGRTPRIHGGGRSRTLTAIDGAFPDYRMLLDGLPAARNRLITARQALRDRLAAGEDGPVTLRAGAGHLVVETGGPAATTLPAICTGPPLRIAFDPAVLLAALDAGVGPDVLLEIASDTQPVVVRSADQGGFTTLVMPVHVGT